jgi:hypothetical protein
MYNVVLSFRDNVVHKIDCGNSLKVAQDTLNELSRQKNESSTYKYFNVDDELVFVANFDNFNYAFIEEKENE